jgi:hypothetical protein
MSGQWILRSRSLGWFLGAGGRGGGGSDTLDAAVMVTVLERGYAVARLAADMEIEKYGDPVPQ